MFHYWVIIVTTRYLGERSESANYWGISLLSVVDKVCGGILIDRIRSSVDRVIGEEQCGFREGGAVWIRYLR